MTMTPEDKAIWHNEIHPRTPIKVAAQIWCREDCAHKTMDETLAQAFAEEIDREQRKATNWLETAHQFDGDVKYYQGLLDQIGALVGPEAFVSDDGSVQDSILRAKLPELARLSPIDK